MHLSKIGLWCRVYVPSLFRGQTEFIQEFNLMLTPSLLLQGFRRFVEPGRVAYVNFGEDYGKMVVIVDAADQSRVLVDGENFPRVIYPVRRLTLTKLKLDLARGARTGTVVAAAKKFGLQAKWAATSASKKIA